MWKHEILKDLIKCKAGNVYAIPEAMDEIINQVNSTVQFFIDDFIDIKTSVLNKCYGTPVDFKVDFNMPFENLLICFKNNNKKRAILVFKRQESEWVVFEIDYYTQNQMWSPLGLYGVIDVKTGKNSQYFFWNTEIDPSLQEIFFGAFCEQVSSLVAFSRLLSCKNVYTQDINPPEKVNKKRIRSGKLPLFSYKVLCLNPLEKMVHAPSWSNRNPTDHNRIHYCRGHFKEFTSERPLLGKYTGLYWWQPHIRGQNRNGMIVKDYAIEVNN